MQDLRSLLAPQVRTLRLIVWAMVLTPVAFGGIVLLIGSQAPFDPAPVRGREVDTAGGAAAIGWIGVGFGAVALAVQDWLGRVVMGYAVKNLRVNDMVTPERLGGVFLTGTVISCAAAEGGAFLNLIAYMVSQSWANLALAAVLIAANATRLPTLERVAVWAERAQRDDGPASASA